MDVILGASIIASFLAGMVALFAPCCITILLPAYIASVFRDKKNVLKMTFVFFAGISVVLIPIGLGAASLANLFKNFHEELYIIGGVLMLLFGVLSLYGKGINFMPMSKKIKATVDANHSKSVFVLGILSGAATSCCAPVLAGAVTLAVISGVFWKALIVTFAYVFGMVFPLFIAAYFYDRFKIEQSKLIMGKEVKISLGKKHLTIHTTNVFAGLLFLVMGVVFLIMAFSGNTFWAPKYQVAIGNSLEKISNSAFGILSNIPNIVWGGILVGAVLFFAIKSLKNK